MNSLHIALKDRYTQPGDQQEAPLDGYWIDVRRSDYLVEIQTTNFSAIRQKLIQLSHTYPIRLVYPIAQEKWIRYLPDERHPQGRRRKSPRRGYLPDLFWELVYLPDMMRNPNFSLEVLLIHEEEIRQDDGRGSWRRGGARIVDRKLLKVCASFLFHGPESLLTILPDDLEETFTNRQLAEVLRIKPKLAGKITYSLFRLNLLESTGKAGRARLWRLDPGLKRTKANESKEA